MMLAPLIPLLILLGTTLVVLLAIAIRRNHGVTAALTLTGLGAALVSICLAAGTPSQEITSLLIADGYSRFFTGLIVATAGVIVVFASSYLEKHAIEREEFYALLLMATLGCSVLAMSRHFVSFFLGLEILSVALYAMIAYLRDLKSPLEAGIKYLILAAASAAFFLFGIALVYADSGTLEFAGAAQTGPAAIILILIGVGFKLALVPFHLWTPDIYEGAPAPVAAFVATASKTAVFAVLVRFFTMSAARQAGVQSGGTLTALAIVAIASMLTGNLLALLQNNVKRIVAYSSIAHLGYVLTALIAGGSAATEAIAVYLMAYTVTILGIFATITALSTSEGDAARLEAFRGLFWRRPAIAVVFTTMLLSLAGIPATLGFVSKFYVIAVGAGASAWTLMVVLVVSSVIGLFYYLRVVVTLYAAETSPELPSVRVSPATGVVLGVLAAILIGLGIYPAPLLSLIRAAVSVL
jgi:NADH-quinone oxidoreductase subunit N